MTTGFLYPGAILEALITLGVLLVLILPIVSIVALVMGAGARSRLDAIEMRLAVLEAMGRDHTRTAQRPGAPVVEPQDELSPGLRPGADGVAPAAPAAAEPPPSSSLPVSSDASPPAEEGAPIPPPPPPPPAAVPPVPPPAGPGLQEQLGTRWAVCAGRPALAL